VREALELAAIVLGGVGLWALLWYGVGCLARLRWQRQAAHKAKAEVGWMEWPNDCTCIYCSGRRKAEEEDARNEK
jgi:hypothetical protein